MKKPETLIAFVALLSLAAGCTSTPTSTSVPPTVTETRVPPTVAPAMPAATSLPRCVFPGGSGSQARRDVEPGSDFWRLSTPEAQGIDAKILSAGLSTLDQSSCIYSFLIVRHNVLVVENYYNGSDRFASNEILSVVKSFVSALVGIAIREGYIGSPQQRLSDLLPEYLAQADEAKKDITLQHLLTMSAGLSDPSSRGSDWVRDTLGASLVTPPGARFRYNAGLPHIMSTLIAKGSGTSTCEFAYQHLFDPLGITVEYWECDPKGYFSGAAGMSLTPRELAKFGLLYLQKGQWEGEQVVPAEWVEESLKRQVRVGRRSDVDPDGDWWLDPAAIGYDAEFDYGYYWWITTIQGHAVYSAIGWGGQRIHIIPDLDMVIVTTSDKQRASQAVDTFSLIEKAIIPAIVPGG